MSGIEKDKDFLHQKCEPVDLNDKELVNKITRELIKTFKEYGGRMQGLSAIQIGIPKNACLIRDWVLKSKVYVIFNLNVVETEGSKISNEGCLSEPGVRVDVERPERCVAEYYMADGTFKRKKLQYPRTRVICHEFDHMNGILLQDKGKTNKEETETYLQAKRLGMMI